MPPTLEHRKSRHPPLCPQRTALLRLPRPESRGLTRGLQTACPPNSGTIKAGTCFSVWSASPMGHGWWSWRDRALTCLESGLGGVGRALCHSQKPQGTRVGRRIGAGEGGHSPGSEGTGAVRGTPGHTAPAPPARAARHTLLEEPARVRSQPGCLSFSEDVGCWEGVSSAFLTEAGGSETCERHRNSR